LNYRINASLLAIAILLPGCASRPPANRETRLNGAGSTFAYPLYLKWANEFGKVHPDVTIDYESIGSGGGIGLVTDGRVDFGATDGPMTEGQIETFLLHEAATSYTCRWLWGPLCRHTTFRVSLPS
jgi:phosphate transport system substrate-binding protein